MIDDPPPAYSLDDVGADPVAGPEEPVMKHTYSFHFSEETIRKGYNISTLGFHRALAH